MLTHPTHDRLLALGLTGMAKALDEQRQQRNVEGLSFEERLGLLVDREAVERESKRLVLRLKYANLRQSAVVEDLDTHTARGLDRALFAKLASGEWIARRQDLLIIGKTGTGKSWLACALGHKACRDDRSVLYHRVPRLLDAIALARGDGRYPRLLKGLARVDLLILDDWGLAPLTSQQGRELLDIVDDRHGRGSTIVTSQVPVKHWHELIADPTIADAVLDRLVHTSHRIELDGPSLRDPKTSRRGEPASLSTQGAAELTTKAKGAKK
jgi:DNA replication protein DnaC